jgi:hypothetical protein
MTMPTFTADASLYRSGSHYRMAMTVDRVAGGPNVLPQLRSIGFCMADCDYNIGDPLSNAACKFDCLGQGGDGGPSGPPTQHCRPSCGPCIDGTRVCIRADCETVERPCRTVGGHRLS